MKLAVLTIAALLAAKPGYYKATATVVEMNPEVIVIETVDGNQWEMDSIKCAKGDTLTVVFDEKNPATMYDNEIIFVTK